MSVIRIPITDQIVEALPRLRETAEQLRHRHAMHATQAEAALMRRRREVLTTLNDPVERWLLHEADDAAKKTRDAIALCELLSSIDPVRFDRELQNVPPSDH